MVDPQQSLGSAYHVSVEKVFVCSGLDGYIPQYDPENKEFGCLADSSRLSYRFKILVSIGLVTLVQYIRVSREKSFGYWVCDWSQSS